MTTLRKHVSDSLRAIGYRRLEKSVHLLSLDADFSLWVNTGVVGLATDIAPYIGLRSHSVEEARGALMDLPDCPTTVTVGANVGYILDGHYRAWSAGSDPAEILSTITAGLEKLRPFASLSALPGAFHFRGVAGSPGTPYVAVVVALLLQDRPTVITRLEDARRVYCSRPDEVCEQFRGFEARVHARLGTVA